jgi:hypothetical protein
MPMEAKVKDSIFISYRRADSEYAASTIHDQLAAHFGRDRVFRDIHTIQPGAEFLQTINHAIKQSSVCLVIIGPNWLSTVDSAGSRRIDDPTDFIRIEIETAFAKDIPIIPVLVGDALIPVPEELPKSLRRLTLLNALVIRSGRDFAGNIERLINGIERFFISPESEVPLLLQDIRSEPQPQFDEPIKKGPLATKQLTGTVFISYRREGGAETARLLRYELLARGWNVFLDVEDLKAGTFDETLLREVARADNFLLIPSPGALENCAQDNDWLRKEIHHAIKTGRNIVPVLKESARRPDKEVLPQDIELLKRVNCVDYSHIYYDATVARFLSFLK